MYNYTDLHGFHQSDIFRREGVESINGRLKSRNGLREVCLTLILDGLRLSCSCIGNSLVRRHHLYIPHFTLQYHTLPFNTTLCHTVPHSATQYHTLYHIVPHSTTLCHIIPHSTHTYFVSITLLLLDLYMWLQAFSIYMYVRICMYVHDYHAACIHVSKHA